MKLLVVFHDSNMFSGATRSMLDLVKTWINDEQLIIEALFPSTGTAPEYMKELGIKTYVKRYYNIRIFDCERTLHISKIKAYVKNVISKVMMYLLSQKLKNEKYDYIYTNTGAIYAGFDLSKQLKIDHIWHVREFGGLDQERIHYDGNKKFAKRLNQSKRIIAISNSIKNYLVSIGVDEQLIDVVYDDVNIAEVKKEIQFDGGKKVFFAISCGGIQEKKGHLDSIKAVEILNKKGICIKLFIVGNTNTSYYNVLKRYVIEHDLECIVKFTNFVENMDFLRNKCDIAVVASYSEAFGRVTIEGMRSKLLVVGANSAGTAELITHGFNGFLFSPGKYEELAQCLEKIVTNWEDMGSIVIQGYEYAKQFCRGEAANKIVGLLKKER